MRIFRPVADGFRGEIIVLPFDGFEHKMKYIERAKIFRYLIIIPNKAARYNKIYNKYAQRNSKYEGVRSQSV